MKRSYGQLLVTFLLVVYSRVQSANIPAYTSCMDAKTQLGDAAQDGEYVLYLPWSPHAAVDIYCAFMQSESRAPQSFLTLRAGRVNNFATVYDSLGSGAECVEKVPAEQYRGRGKTEFTRLAIDLKTLTVDTADFTFSNTTGPNQIPYATAGDMFSSSASCSPMGLFQIDLTDTPFTLPKDQAWAWSGNYTRGNVTHGNAQLNDHSYLGCYRDSTDRLLTSRRYDDPENQTIYNCIERCTKPQQVINFEYAGLEYGFECHCGSNSKKFGRPVDDSYCDKPCVGNTSLICGGTWYASIYKTGVSQTLTGRCGGYPGRCWPGSQNDRTAPKLKLAVTDVCLTSNPCRNEGRCVAVTATKFRCICYEGYTGDRCEVRNKTVVEDGFGCPPGLVAEKCRCSERQCLGARFEGGVCKTMGGTVVCHPGDPGHVVLYDVEEQSIARCTENSEIVGCSFWNLDARHYSHGEGRMYRSSRTCQVYSTGSKQVQARCKRYLCGCKNGGHCNRVTGQCECKPPYYGSRCETFSYCQYYSDKHNATLCPNSALCTAVHRYSVPAKGGDRAGSTCIFPFEWGDSIHHTCVSDDKAGPPFACSGEFSKDGETRSYINLGAWNPGPRYTVATWVSPEVINTMRQTIVGGVSHCNDFGFNFNSGTFRGYLKLSTECTRDLDAGLPLVQTGKWYMVAVTSNATHASIYVDGELRETNTVLLNHIPTTEGFWIGAAVCCTADYFKGRIKNVKVWNRALSVDEIVQSMNTVGSANTTNEALYSGLVGHWELGKSAKAPSICDGHGAINHGGSDWSPADGETISGIHCNIGRFIVAKGMTVVIARYNGSTGGTVDISAQEVEIAGYIDGVGAGYRGGATSSVPGAAGQQGESYVGGPGSVLQKAGRGAGGGGAGGSQMADGAGRSGGGAGYGTVGSDGIVPTGDRTGVGSGGSAYGYEHLDHMYLGSGGGSGGNANNLQENPQGGRGGNGGGSIRIWSDTTIKLTGVISVAGQAGQGDIVQGTSCKDCPEACDQRSPVRCRGNSSSACWDMSGPGGGGSGGSIYLSASRLDIGFDKLWAMGGGGGAGAGQICGGNGGKGRIRLDYKILQGTLKESYGVITKHKSQDLIENLSVVGQAQIDYTNTVHGNEVFRGCFKDVDPANRTLAVDIPSDASTANKMTPDFCRDMCRQRNFKFSGTQNGSLCYCDNHLYMDRKVADSECSSPCQGNPLWSCGGSGRLQVFGPPPSTPALAVNVETRCRPWCVTANPNTDQAKWGECDLPASDELAERSWDYHCQCPAGRTGPNCSQVCPQWTYGFNCRRNCTCNRQSTSGCIPNDGSCRCKPGFSGAKCGDTCPPGTYGEDCKHTCTCKDRTVCDHVTGACKCAAGWMGLDCNFPCPENKFGYNCTETCRDCNHGTCSPLDGTCQCFPGYQQPYCYEKCARFRYGQDCESACDCNGSPCDPVYGTCRCGPGYTGPQCARQCPFGFYGHNCQSICACKGSSCHHVTGRCNCYPGWTGDKCQTPCPPETFGFDCRHKVSCVMNHTRQIDPATGQCFGCVDGYYGYRCQLACPGGYSGPDCATKSACTCLSGYSCLPPTPNCTCPASKSCREVCGCNHGTCHKVTARCVCDAGWTGDHCDEICPKGTYGERCERSCTCQHGHCYHKGGPCMCMAGYTGSDCDVPCTNNTFGHDCGNVCPDCGPHAFHACNVTTGACRCSPGYIGFRCDEMCPSGFYGDHCKATCRCQNGAVCNNVDGRCHCTAGYTGAFCESKCPSGTWGMDCKHLCQCGPYADSCDPVDGRCSCKPGFLGVRCRESCPRGSWGVNCSSQCQCDVITSVCSPINGACGCLPGYTGDKCQQVCKPGWWGRNCNLQCDCNERGTCNPSTGHCDCIPGFTGNTCERQCAQDIEWGVQCRNLCSCNGHHCDHRTGQCLCSPGTIGHHCENSCDEFHFGVGCAQLCGCRNGARCDPVTGACHCQPGWSGVSCDQTCPEGYYGAECSQTCPECLNGGTCDTFSGLCVCRPDFTGQHCNSSIMTHVTGAERQAQALSPSGLVFSVPQFVAIIAGMIVLMIIIIIAAVFISRKCSLGRFARTSGAIKFNTDELDRAHFDTPASDLHGSGFVNPVHNPSSYEETNVDQKTTCSSATDAGAAGTMDTEEEDNKFFKDSAA